jgi:hypothetical protein
MSNNSWPRPTTADCHTSANLNLVLFSDRILLESQRLRNGFGTEAGAGDVPEPLKNTKHEAFVRGLLENKTALQAYADAGYNADDANASRLKSRPDVVQRLAELQSEIAAETTVTVQGLINELEDARKKATDLKQLSAAIKAIEGKAKLSGLMVEKKQIEVGPPGAFDGLDTVEAICDKLAEQWLSDVNWWHGVTEDDQAKLAAIFAEAFERAGAFMDAITARPPTKLAIAPPRTSPNGKIHP